MRKKIVELPEEKIEHTFLTKNEIEIYTKKVDSLFLNGLLEERIYPNRSKHAGVLTGYFENNNLVYYEGMTAGEFGYLFQKGYLRNSKFYKLITKSHIEAENGVPEPNQDGEVDKDNIVFNNEITTVHFTENIEMLIVLNGKEISHHLGKRNSILNNEINRAKEIVLEVNSIKIN
jgi:hypothetical protein